ncbi:helix-turn-helix transcriptional regulator [Paenibacillus jiagnxiensis]|uniref:helix-turn-helix transcriptional regulator n=1 Tax=Paenibacillus jiagnxiensis TaxID=3228926 RepID=UPI0033A87B5C
MKIKEARELKRLAQEQVAVLVDTSVRHYQRIEAGQDIPNVILALDICRALEIDPRDVEEWQDSSKRPRRRRPLE